MFLLIACWISPFINIKQHFNTSHVSINPAASKEEYPDIEDFNTSHVSINQRFVHDFRFRKIISIHLMFLLIDIGLACIHRVRGFQYISCFY